MHVFFRPVLKYMYMNFLDQFFKLQDIVFFDKILVFNNPYHKLGSRASIKRTRTGCTTRIVTPLLQQGVTIRVAHPVQELAQVYYIIFRNNSGIQLSYTSSKIDMLEIREIFSDASFLHTSFLMNNRHNVLTFSYSKNG